LVTAPAPARPLQAPSDAKPEELATTRDSL